MITNNKRDYLWNYYTTDNRAQINLNIRKHLTPLMEHDQQHIELLNNLLLSIPNTPTLYYNNEINMDNNIYLNNHNNIRTPIQ